LPFTSTGIYRDSSIFDIYQYKNIQLQFYVEQLRIKYWPTWSGTAPPRVALQNCNFIGKDTQEWCFWSLPSQRIATAWTLQAWN
jgi:hypothetical protein